MIIVYFQKRFNIERGFYIKEKKSYLMGMFLNREIFEIISKVLH